MKYSAAVFAASLASACTPMTPAASSSKVLAPERTWVIVAKPARPAAIDMVRMFNVRGFALVDMTPDERGVTLRFKGERKTVAEPIVTALDVIAAVGETVEVIEAAKRGREYHPRRIDPAIEHYELGSVFYVRVEPRGETMTSIAAIGRPTRSGVEACTADVELSAPCAPLETGPGVHHEVAGVVEAELITGVFAELRVGGAVIAPDIHIMTASRRCWERRREVTAAASRVSNSRAKAGILRTAPVCDAAAASLATAAHGNLH